MEHRIWDSPNSPFKVCLSTDTRLGRHGPGIPPLHALPLWSPLHVSPLGAHDARFSLNAKEPNMNLLKNFSMNKNINYSTFLSVGTPLAAIGDCKYYILKQECSAHFHVIFMCYIELHWIIIAHQYADIYWQFLATTVCLPKWLYYLPLPSFLVLDSLVLLKPFPPLLCSLCLLFEERELNKFTNFLYLWKLEKHTFYCS